MIKLKYLFSILYILVISYNSWSQHANFSSDSILVSQMESYQKWLSSGELGKILKVDSFKVVNNDLEVYLGGVFQGHSSHTIDSLILGWKKLKQVYRKHNPKRLHSKLFSVLKFYSGFQPEHIIIFVKGKNERKCWIKIYSDGKRIRLDEKLVMPLSSINPTQLSLYELKNSIEKGDTITRNLKKELRNDIVIFLKKRFPDTSYKLTFLWMDYESKIISNIQGGILDEVECNVTCLFNEVIPNEEQFEKILFSIKISTLGKKKFQLQASIEGMYDKGWQCNPKQGFFKGINKIENPYFYKSLVSFGKNIFGELEDYLKK